MVLPWSLSCCSRLLLKKSLSDLLVVDSCGKLTKCLMLVPKGCVKGNKPHDICPNVLLRPGESHNRYHSGSESWIKGRSGTCTMWIAKLPLLCRKNVSGLSGKGANIEAQKMVVTNWFELNWWFVEQEVSVLLKGGRRMNARMDEWEPVINIPDQEE